jgi:hypothetical protein
MTPPMTELAAVLMAMVAVVVVTAIFKQIVALV